MWRVKEVEFGFENYDRRSRHSEPKNAHVVPVARPVPSGLDSYLDHNAMPRYREEVKAANRALGYGLLAFVFAVATGIVWAVWL